MANLPEDGGTLSASADYPIKGLHNLAMVLVVGDSVAGGDNATGKNRIGGHGFARMLVKNPRDFPAYASHDLTALYPSVDFRDASRKNATSMQAKSSLEGAIARRQIPDSVPGDALLLIYVGSNDFFMDGSTMIDTAQTQTAASMLRSNLAVMISIVSVRYAKRGKAMLTLVSNIIDPTDGTGSIPVTFTEGLCKQFQSPSVQANKAKVVSNLQMINDEIANEVDKRGARLIDVHTGFMGHGMNSDKDRFLDDDSQSLTNAGHDLIRRLAWKVLTGESY